MWRSSKSLKLSPFFQGQNEKNLCEQKIVELNFMLPYQIQNTGINNNEFRYICWSYPEGIRLIDFGQYFPFFIVVEKWFSCKYCPKILERYEHNNYPCEGRQWGKQCTYYMDIHDILNSSIYWRLRIQYAHVMEGNRIY